MANDYLSYRVFKEGCCFSTFIHVRPLDVSRTDALLTRPFSLEVRDAAIVPLSPLALHCTEKQTLHLVLTPSVITLKILWKEHSSEIL